MKKKYHIKKYLLVLLAAIMIGLTIIINLTVYNASFEQYIYSLLKVEGTSAPIVPYTVLLGILIVLITFLILILPTINFGKKIVIKISQKNINKEIQIYPIKKLKLYNKIVLILAIIFVGFGFGFFDYLKNSFLKTDLFKKYYVAPSNVEVTFPEKKKNLIYIFLESTEMSNVSQKNGGVFNNSIIPNLERIALDNLNFSNSDRLGGASESYGTGWTVAAMIAQTSGVPLKIKVNDYEESSTSFDNIQTIGDILYDNGYDNYLLLGSDSSFGGRKAYFSSHNYQISDYYTAIEEGKINSDYHVWWGYEDSKLFTYAKEKLETLSQSSKPFNLTILTADTHFTDGYLDPSCSEKFDNNYANSFYCSDSMLNDFITWIQSKDFYQDTVIVITGDHHTMQENFYKIDKNYTRTIYNAIINSDTKYIANKNRIFTTMDMFPTTLAAIGANIEGERLGLGTNLFSDKKTIPEEIGLDNFNNELKKKSKSYYEYIRG